MHIYRLLCTHYEPYVHRVIYTRADTPSTALCIV